MLMNHLKRIIIKSDANKMTSRNLAVCFGPVLLCPGPGAATDLQAALDVGKQIQALNFFLDIWPESRGKTI